MKRLAVLKQYKHTMRVKQEYEVALAGLEDLLYSDTYTYEGIQVFVSEIDIENELLLVCACDDSMPFLGGTDNITSVDIQEFISKAYK